MALLEFQASVKDGVIEIPEAYRHTVTTGDTVKIIVLKQPSEKPENRQRDIFDELRENPISVEGFLTREEAHDRKL